MSVAFGIEVSTAFWLAAPPGLTVATAAAAVSLINDFGAGTNDGSSSTAVVLAGGKLLDGTVGWGLVFCATVADPGLVFGATVAGSGLVFCALVCVAFTGLATSRGASGSWIVGLRGSARAAAICSSRSASRIISASEPVVGDCNVPLGRISSSRGVTAGARSTRGVTLMTISTWRRSRVGAVNKRPMIGNPPRNAMPLRPRASMSVETLASIIVRLF